MAPDDECMLHKEPFSQCCCNCVHHHADHFHCTTEPNIRKQLRNDQCVCGIRKGWVCAGFANEGRVYSNWPEHSVGCEMYFSKERAAKLREERSTDA